MPSAAEVNASLTALANGWVALAVAWHALIVVAALALAGGWQPPRRWFGALLALPLASVSALAWWAGNPFNGTVFGAAASVLGLLAWRLHGAVQVRRDAPSLVAAVALLGFGLVYPHFLVEGPAWRYLYAAPTGVVPCPTLAVVIGLAWLVDGLGARAWTRTLAALGVGYGGLGVFWLQVPLDAGLLVGALAFAAMVPGRAETMATAGTARSG